MKLALCSQCSVDDHVCTMPFTCECPMCRREKAKTSGVDFTVFQVDAEFLVEDVMA